MDKEQMKNSHTIIIFIDYFLKTFLLHRQIGTLLKELIAYLKMHRSIYGFKTFISPFLPADMLTKARLCEKGYLNREFARNYKKNNSIADNLYASKSLNDALLNHFEYKLEHLLKWEDRNSMWFSLEARIPFLDYRLVERTLALPSTDVIRKGKTKHILREAMKVTLPEKIRIRKDKIGFGTPQDEWFKVELFQRYIKGLLNSESLKSRNFIGFRKVQNLYQTHVSGVINISQEIWKWINLELWYRVFINK